MWLAKGLTPEIALDRLVDLLPLLALVIVATAVLEIGVYFFFKKVLRSSYTLPYTLVAPAAVALLLFTVYPFFYNIRLAFSDLRIRTMSCYIPNAEITNAECALGRAASGEDVDIKVDSYEVRVEPNETADVAYTVEKGDEVHVTATSQKINNYILYSGSPVKLNDDGTPSNTLCGADPLCVRAFNEYKAQVLDVQDQRNWWPVRNKEGNVGWIPNEVFYATADASLYSASTGGGDPVATVTEKTEVRQITLSSSEWYEVRLADDQSGWANADLVVASRAFFPPDEITLYKEMSSESETVGTAAAEQELDLLQNVTITWYQVYVNADLIGWVRLPVQSTSTIDVFFASGDAEVYDAFDSEGEPTGDPVASIATGDELILVSTDTSTDTTWYQVTTADGVTGWVGDITAPEVSTVDVFNMPAETPIYNEKDTTSESPGTVSEGQRVRPVERDTSDDVTWNRVRTGDNVIGWTTAEGRIATNYTASDDVEVFAEIGGAGDVVHEAAKGDRLNLASTKPTKFVRYQVRLPDGTVGWVNDKPRQVTTTERDIVLYSLNYGWENFKRVFVKTDSATDEITGWGRLLQTENSTFPRLMRTTVAWTVLNVIFHLVFGMMIALILNRPGLKFRGLYRAIIILPWAIPQTIIALAWRGEFHFNFGFVNTLLTQIGLEPVNWLFTPTPAFVAVTFVNIWLGIPFYMVTLLGGLQSIAGEYYEAAEIDGANSWQRFWNVTVPLIRPVAVPIVTLDVIWTFNNFNVIYLITRGEPNESTNILVTALYNAAFGRNGQFQLGFAAAFSLIIFLVLFLFASFWITSSGALKGVYES